MQIFRACEPACREYTAQGQKLRGALAYDGQSCATAPMQQVGVGDTGKQGEEGVNSCFAGIDTAGERSPQRRESAFEYRRKPVGRFASGAADTVAQRHQTPVRGRACEKCRKPQ